MPFLYFLVTFIFFPSCSGSGISSSFSMILNPSSSSSSSSVYGSSTVSLTFIGLSGIIFVSLVDSSTGMLLTLATSLMAILAAIVPKVITCDIWSLPYVSSTYLNTLYRPSSSKSISISGIDIRSGLRKRSKRSWYLIGSILVMPRQYATADPAAEPRPGPTEIPFLLAADMKSCTIRK